MSARRRLKIHEIYLSVQGESSFIGLPCVFVRTTGCPLRCSWCDTKQAFYGGQESSVEAVLEAVASYDPAALVEVTGGEPLAQKNVLPLMAALADAGRTVLLETSGALDISAVDERVHIIMDLKCPDSGESERNRWENLRHLRRERDELKLVLASRRDYEFARDTIDERDLASHAQLLLSTVFGALEPADVVQWMLDDRLPARFQLQLHKLIWSPEATGV
ncbi:MAG: 7-carboxy-7-deazaguanine synthase QueE [Proteobacteria bacterium]|nr:MAG: 7-carboxy-7-deazaguanine synthase QueE [Pseudomonadota bacterium]